MSVLRLFPSLRKTQPMNGKEKTLDSKSAKWETEKPLSRLIVQRYLGDLSDEALQCMQGVKEERKG